MSQKNLTIAVASGKGGVGKSMLASSLAVLFSKNEKITAVDADVDAPNLHLWLGGVDRWDEVKDLSLTEKAEVLKPDFNCQEFNVDCQFGAIDCQNGRLEVNPFLCEGCGLCQEILPAGVIEMKKAVNGQIRVKKDVLGFPLVSGRLFPGQTGSGKIVDEIISYSQKFESRLRLIDIPAGIGCPVTAGIKEADGLVLVTEPTPTGRADLRRILTVINNFNLPWRFVVNKFNINNSLSAEIIQSAQDKFLGKISYDNQVFKKLSKLEPVMKTDLKIKPEIENIHQRLLNWISHEFS